MHENQIFIISGNKAQGKTTFVKKLIHHFSIQKLKIIGFYAKGYWEKNIRSGFDLIDPNSNKNITLCKHKPVAGWIRISYYWFNPAAIEWGTSVLLSAKNAADSLVIIDEIGMLEVKKLLWYKSLQILLFDANLPILLTVRKQFVDSIIASFNLKNVLTFDIEKNTPQGVCKKITNIIHQR